MKKVSEKELILELDQSLRGDLVVPHTPKGLVIFVHGSGSSRRSSRNRHVASVLQQRGFATLLFDLLTESEDADPANRFDIGLLTNRLRAVTAWVRRNAQLAQLPIAYFGASTGAAAALQAATEPGSEIFAIVSRGGRPDLAIHELPYVFAPTLLIVGGADHAVIDLNRKAYAMLECPKKLEIVPGATHLFEEPGALERVARLAADWLETQVTFSEHDKARGLHAES